MLAVAVQVEPVVAAAPVPVVLSVTAAPPTDRDWETLGLTEIKL